MRVFRQKCGSELSWRGPSEKTEKGDSVPRRADFVTRTFSLSTSLCLRARVIGTPIKSVDPKPCVLDRKDPRNS